jgi:hypothetical protein
MGPWQVYDDDIRTGIGVNRSPDIGAQDTTVYERADTMINQIIEAIASAMNTEFNATKDNYEIYVNDIKQGLKEPCFFISCLSPSMQLYPSRRYKRENFFCVQYFPESEEARTECMDVAERLFECLEYIWISGDTKPMHGTGMRYEINDEVMSFFVNYNCFVQKKDNTEKMGTLRHNVRVR